MDADFDHVFIDLRENSSTDRSHTASYDDEQAVLRWDRMTKDPDYTLYGDCETALTTLLEPTNWEKLTSSRSVGAVIDLGVGTGGKTCKILNRIAAPQRTFAVILADASRPMLKHAYERIRRELAGRLHACAVLPVGIDMERSLRRLRDSPNIQPHFSSEKANLFFLLGCTFANIPEDRMLSGLRSTLAPGDVIVLGIECFRTGNHADKPPRGLFAPYKSFSFKSYWMDYCKRTYGAGPDYANMIKLDYEEDSLRSAIPNTRSIVASLSGNYRDSAPLMVANRYNYAELIEYVTGFSFRHKLSVASPNNPYYFHVAFEKV